MREIIKIIFKEKEFEVNESIIFSGEFGSNFSFYTRTHSDKNDFYLVAFIKENEITFENLKEQLDQYFETIVEEMDVTGIDKNLSFLLLLETDLVNYSKEKLGLIYNLEEDPYDYKKYVLTYTETQVKALKNVKEKISKPIYNVLNSLLQDKKLFVSFKKRVEDRNSTEMQEALLYDLVTKLFIKIPFLNVVIKQESLVNLKNEIEKSLSIDQARIVNLILEQYSIDPELNINGILNKLGVEYVE